MHSLTKDYVHRPKYKELLEHPWIRWHERTHADVAGWFREARAKMAVAQAQSASPNEQQHQVKGAGASAAAAAAAVPDSGVISNQPAQPLGLGDVSVASERDKFEHMAEAATRHKAEMLERLANPIAQRKSSASARHYSSGCASASSSVNNSLSTTPTAISKPLPGAASGTGHSSLANTVQRSSAASRMQHSNSPAAVPHGRSSTTAACGWRRQLSTASTPISHGSSGSIASPCSATGASASAARSALEAVPMPMGALSDAPEDASSSSCCSSTTVSAVGAIGGAHLSNGNDTNAIDTPPVPYRQAHSRTRKISVV